MAIFKELKQYGLIEEQRRGNGLPNYIYLYKVEVSDQDADTYCQESRCEEMTGHQAPGEADGSNAMPESEAEPTEKLDPDVSKGNVLNCKNVRSVCVDFAGQDVKKVHPSYIDFSYKDFSENIGSKMNSSQSVNQLRRIGTEIEEGLGCILNRCELHQFSDDEAQVLKESFVRLYYSHSIRIGDAVLPQTQIHERLRYLDGEILQTAYGKICSNTRPVKNSIGYIMTVIYNANAEKDGDLLVDPYLNSFRKKGEKRQC